MLIRKLSILVPAYNEEKTIQEVIKRLSQISYPCDHEIIVINDASTDKTLEQALQLRSEIENLKIISYNRNKGKGFAIRRGLVHATGNLFIIQDADLEYSPEQIPKLVNLTMQINAKIIYGNRFWNNSLKEKMTYIAYYGNKIISRFLSKIHQVKIHDVETCYKLFTKEVIKSINLKLNDFGFEIEFTSKVLKKGFKIIETPITYNPRTRKQGKKITWRDGLKAIFYILKFKLKK